MLFLIFSFSYQTNLETELSLCRTELEADVGKTETLSKAARADLAQVLPSFPPAVNACPSAALSSWLCGLGYC